jgi:hypothetical protein
VSDVDRARQAAVSIVLEYGMPDDREQLAARLAYAYACGARDGYIEAAETAGKAWSDLIGELDQELGGK